MKKIGEKTTKFGTDAFQTATQKNIYLQYAGRCSETGMSYYRLSSVVPRETWRMIAEHFERFGFDDEDGELYGWLTSQPETVEKILGVKEELTLAYRRREAKKRKEKKEKKARELQAKIDDVKKAFSEAEYPKTENKMRVEGEKIQNPLNPENPWGGGEWWVIQPEWIWHVQNNGFDGDDWTRNNIETGGAGAIGVRVPFSEELAARIRGLKK
jgi:hypothetical protein